MDINAVCSPTIQCNIDAEHPQPQTLLKAIL